MKRISKMMMGLAVAVAGTLTLAACGTMTNDFISLKNEKVELGGQNYQNTSDFRLDYKGDNKYEALGATSVMTQAQADAFWNGVASEGDEYVVISIKFDAGSQIIYGFEDQSANFDSPDGTKVKTVTNNTEENDKLDLILRVNKDKSTFKVVEKDKEENSETFKIDMTKLNYKDAE